jgi:5-(carboxyamino)imidazole ribonucleotide mutase
MDSLMSMVQMPRGYPVGTVAIGEWGAVNAGILAAQIVGLIDPTIQDNIEKRRAKITDDIEAATYIKPEA